MWRNACRLGEQEPAAEQQKQGEVDRIKPDETAPPEEQNVAGSQSQAWIAMGEHTAREDEEAIDAEVAALHPGTQKRKSQMKVEMIGQYPERK
jgi:hypothetical protein